MYHEYLNIVNAMIAKVSVPLSTVIKSLGFLYNYEFFFLLAKKNKKTYFLMQTIMPAIINLQHCVVCLKNNDQRHNP